MKFVKHITIGYCRICTKNITSLPGSNVAASSCIHPSSEFNIFMDSNGKPLAEKENPSEKNVEGLEALNELYKALGREAEEKANAFTDSHSSGMMDTNTELQKLVEKVKELEKENKMMAKKFAFLIGALASGMNNKSSSSSCSASSQCASKKMKNKRKSYCSNCSSRILID